MSGFFHHCMHDVCGVFFVSLYSYHFYKKLWTMGWSSVSLWWVLFCFFSYFCNYAFKNLSVFGRKQSPACIIFLVLLEDRTVSGFPVV